MGELPSFSIMSDYGGPCPKAKGGVCLCMAVDSRSDAKSKGGDLGGETVTPSDHLLFIVKVLPINFWIAILEHLS